jgi:hypothetical protein
MSTRAGRRQAADRCARVAHRLNVADGAQAARSQGCRRTLHAARAAIGLVPLQFGGGQERGLRSVRCRRTCSSAWVPRSASQVSR